MLIIVTGASSSGKSEIAETIAEDMGGRLYYIATMNQSDKESLRRIRNHQRMRAQKGFETIEKYTDIAEIQVESDATCLLECMSNLLANELYSREPDKRNCKKDSTDKSVSDKIVYEIKSLYSKVKNLIIVTNDVFSDGTLYDESCTQYIDNLGYINRKLGKDADVVIESVVGIPIYIKHI